MKNIFSYLLLSISAVALTLIMILLGSSATNTITFEDRLFVTVAFVTSCIFGISIAIYPSWWKKFLRHADRKSNIKSEKTVRAFRGHHPDCDTFKSHSIMIKNKLRCAGCLGLIIGSIESIFMMVLFLFILPNLSLTTLYFLFGLGLLIPLFIYGEIMLPKRHAIIHIILNIALIFGFFCLTIGVIEITRNAIYAILTIIICFLLLDTRIQLSNWNHTRMCNSCPESCKMY
jgi:hypothetical protein